MGGGRGTGNRHLSVTAVRGRRLVMWVREEGFEVVGT